MNKKTNLNLLYILKDEGEKIQESIESFHIDGNPIYDRLVIAIDDSTTDDTLEKVKLFTKEISFFKWEEDFAKHRNELISKIPVGRNEFIMFPDGHEVLRNSNALYSDQKSIESLQLFLSNPPEKTEKGIPMNLFSTWIEIDVDKWDIPYVLFFRPLFFRNTGKVYFKRKVHNHLWDEEGPAFKIPQISFIHNMPSKRKEMRSQMRGDMNRRGLITTVNASPKDVRSLFYLAETYDEVNDLQNAVKFYKKAFRLTDQKDKDMSSQICISMMNLYCRFQKYEKAVAWSFNGMRNNWNRAEIYYFLGVTLTFMERYEEAIHWFNVSLKLRLPLNTSYFLLGGVYSWLPLDGMMYAKNKMGDTEGSLEAAKKVLRYKPTDEVLLENITNLEEFINDHKAKELLLEIPEVIDKFKPISKEMVK